MMFETELTKGLEETHHKPLLRWEKLSSCSSPLFLHFLKSSPFPSSCYREEAPLPSTPNNVKSHGGLLCDLHHGLPFLFLPSKSSSLFALWCLEREESKSKRDCEGESEWGWGSVREWRVLPSDSTSCWGGQVACHVGPRSPEMDNSFVCRSCSSWHLGDTPDHPLSVHNGAQKMQNFVCKFSKSKFKMLMMLMIMR